ncbi:MAG: toprim domain-containing protein [Methylobacter sp.]|uniref:toprim domain-containing protein n=1 Tax=Methylobacter sp. TaxID=2051955 RepID=UPI0025D7CFEB|nr:toprim domain-containing protein [Methylobacter sp.]MCK9622022.1 toprim domain-containing protein [Methylobacter sp.]
MIEEFKNAMRDCGIEPPRDIFPDGVLRRFKIKNKSCGWVILHGGDYWAGAFGDWSKDFKAKWKQKEKEGVKKIYSKEEIDRIKNHKKEEEINRRIKRSEAAVFSQNIWSLANECISHTYLTKKRVKSYGLKAATNGILLVPIYNRFGALVNLQRIYADGTKKFMTGAEITGCFFMIEGESDTIIICEGYATGASIHEHYGCTVVVAFNAGNLPAVAKSIAEIYRGNEIIIAADNDESGVGERKAKEACLAIGCSYIMPDVVGMDFNDIISMSL